MMVCLLGAGLTRSKLGTTVTGRPGRDDLQNSEDVWRDQKTLGSGMLRSCDQQKPSFCYQGKMLYIYELCGFGSFLSLTSCIWEILFFKVSCIALILYSPEHVDVDNSMRTSQKKSQNPEIET